MIATESSGTFLELLRTGPSLSNAHTPVHTANAPSLSRTVFPVTVMLAASAHTLMAASGDGMAALSVSSLMPRYLYGLGCSRLMNL